MMLYQSYILISVVVLRNFSTVVIKKFKLWKSNKNRTSYIEKKCKHVKVLQFPSTNFIILRSLHDSLIINTPSYISFKILVKYQFSWVFSFVCKNLIYYWGAKV